MSEYRRQFVFRKDRRNRWHWWLCEDGMELVARSFKGTRTLDECIAHARSVAGISRDADLWCAPTQSWIVDGVEGGARVADAVLRARNA